jgi:hypothetical protein
MRGPPDPETNKAALAGRLVRKTNFHTADHTEISPKLQASRLVSKFGFAFETAVTISQLAWGSLPR